jgi:hypothetical protein
VTDKKEAFGERLSCCGAAAWIGGRVSGAGSWRSLIHGRLLFRLAVPVVLALVLLGFAINDEIRGQVPLIVLLWVVPGLLVGYPLGHFTKVAWSSDGSQLMQGRGDWLVMGLYIALRTGERTLFTPQWINLPYISSAGALVGVGLLLGRSAGLAGRIRQMLARRPPPADTPSVSAS